MALWRAKIKPPVELVVDDLEMKESSIFYKTLEKCTIKYKKKTVLICYYIQYQTKEYKRLSYESERISEKDPEFPQAAVDELKAVLERAKQTAQNPDLTDAQMQEEVANIHAAREAFLDSQNPLPEKGRYTISMENLTFLEGKTSYLMDKQMATAVKLAETGVQENAGILFGFGEKEVLLSEFAITENRR